MSEPSSSEDRDLLAAEYSLSVLEGPELAGARRLETSDPTFAAAIAAWNERLAPLFDEVAPVPADPAIWRRIEAMIDPPAANDNLPRLEQRLRTWRGAAFGAGALAASLAGIIAFQPSREAPPTVQAERAPILVATLSSESAPASLSVTYDGQQRSVLVSPGRLENVQARDHELWIIPAGGQPISLGIVGASAPQRLPVPAELEPHFQQRAQIALSVEPIGGSPTGSPTGPVIAAGELLLI